MRGSHYGPAIVVAVAIVVASGCQYLPPLPPLPPNPFQAPPTPEPTLEPTPRPIVLIEATPTPSFREFWVKNHKITEMWSGPAGQAGVISFGPTSAQFCSFRVVRPPDGPRLYVLNPFTNNYFWIDADAVGPVADPPERRPGPKPADQNCAEVIYES